MKKFISNFFFIVIVAAAVVSCAHLLYGGVPADATPGDIWRMFKMW